MHTVSFLNIRYICGVQRNFLFEKKKKDCIRSLISELSNSSQQNYTQNFPGDA
jgi:hypothetical protein